MQQEEWRPFDTGTIAIEGYEVSSLGKVREIRTGKVLKLEGRASKDVSPHYQVDNTWWLPVVLVRSVFTNRIHVPVAPKVEATPAWDGEIIEDAPSFGPKRRPRIAKVEREEKTPIVRHPSRAPISVPETLRLQPEIVEARSAEVELAQMLYRPYKPNERQIESAPTPMQTPQDRMAQRVSTNRAQTVHGVDRVLKLYRTSAHKRGYAWELTDEKAIKLMVSACLYCGCEPGTHNRNGLNGIDRTDNAEGYTESNAVPCCGKCNMMKGQRAPEEFIGHVFSIAEHQRETQSRIEV